MDEHLRGLHRQFRQSGDPEDGVRFYLAALRGGYAVDLQEVAGFISHRELQQIALHNPGQLVLAGRSVQDILLYTCQDLIWQGAMPPGPLPEINRELLFAAICYVYRSIPGRTPPAVMPFYRIYYYTVNRQIVPCPACRQLGPHLCEEFVHPDAEYGIELEESTEETQYSDPIFQDAAEQDVKITRKWYPTQTAPRQMGNVYSYVVHCWIIENLPPDFNVAHADGWYLVNNNPMLSLTDPDTQEREALRTRLRNDVRSSVRSDIRGQDISGRPVIQGCLAVSDNIDSLIISGEHEPLEKPPTLDTSSCEDYAIVPGGTVAWEFDPVSGSRVINDTTTTCGHGYVKEPRVIPLCPPRWSDGVQAGWRCNNCAKLLGLSAGRPGEFVMCRVCQRRMQLERQVEMGGPARVSREIYICPCGQKYDSLEDAVDCCGDDEDDIDIREYWDWDSD